MTHLGRSVCVCLGVLAYADEVEECLRKICILLCVHVRILIRLEAMRRILIVHASVWRGVFGGCVVVGPVPGNMIINQSPRSSRECTAIMLVWHNHTYASISMTFKNRHWLRDLPDRHLHGHVLQYDHRLGGLLSVRVVQLRAAVDVMRQRVEHGELHSGEPTDQSHQCVQSGQGVL